MRELTGKTAVVTGGASGIGRALAGRFAAAGMRIVLADVEAPALDRAVQELRGDGAEVIGVTTDVSDAQQVDSLAAQSIDAFGDVHVVCNNAGVGARGTMDTLELNDWRWVIGVNLWGVINGIRSFLPHLLANDEGHIVNTASIAGVLSFPQMGPYAASKFGVVGLSEVLFKELAMSGSHVGVSLLCPGLVATRIHDCERNRPADLAGTPVREEAADLRDDARIRREMPASEVAERVYEAIVRKQFYVFTDDSFDDQFRQRHADIEGSRNPTQGLLAP